MTERLVIRVVGTEPEEVHRVIEWHRQKCAAVPYLLQRGTDDYDRFVQDQSVWVAFDETKQPVAAAYYTKSKDDFEIGGLVVEDEYQARGLGTVIVNVVLGAIILNEEPFRVGSRIIAHVHKQNDKVCSLFLANLKFRLLEEVRLSAESVPGLPVDENGYVVGLELGADIDNTIANLRKWASIWRNKLNDGSLVDVVYHEQDFATVLLPEIDVLLSGYEFGLS